LAVWFDKLTTNEINHLPFVLIVSLSNDRRTCSGLPWCMMDGPECPHSSDQWPPAAAAL